jgi:tetratricopeptide (TPR) repeat protein
MRPYYQTGLWLLLVGLTPQTGCVALKDATVQTATGPGASGASVTLPAQPLAAFHDNETEKLCLTAAARFEDNECWGEAIVQLEKARKANPKLEMSHRLALLYEKEQDYPKALAEYNKELEAAKQNDADVLNGILAGLKKLVGRPLPKSSEPLVLTDIGYCLYLKGDWAESERYLNLALEKDPQNATAWVNLGLTLAAQNRVEDSLNAAQHAIAPAAAYANVAFVQATRLGRLVEAKALYRKALELDPNNQLAQRALTELEQIEKKEAAKSTAPAPGQPG